MFRVLLADWAILFQSEFFLVFGLGIGFVFSGDVVAALTDGAGESVCLPRSFFGHKDSF